MEARDSRVRGTIVILLSMAIFGAIFVIGVGFVLQTLLPQKPQDTCADVRLNYCYTEKICEDNKLYWYDNGCHNIKQPPSEYPDKDSLKDMKSLELVNDFITYTPNSQRNSNLSKYVSFMQKGEIAKGYIEIEASIDNGPLTKWESIYMKINYNSPKDYKINGGHVFRPLSLKLPPGDKTHLLFALNDIPYLESQPYDESKIPSHSNWFRYFKDGNKNDFMVFISSLTPAKIDFVKIYYKCLENSDCSLTLGN